MRMAVLVPVVVLLLVLTSWRPWLSRAAGGGDDAGGGEVDDSRGDGDKECNDVQRGYGCHAAYARFWGQYSPYFSLAGVEVDGEGGDEDGEGGDEDDEGGSDAHDDGGIGGVGGDSGSGNGGGSVRAPANGVAAAPAPVTANRPPIRQPPRGDANAAQNSPATPPGCAVRAVQILARHGARHPTAARGLEYEALLSRIQQDTRWEAVFPEIPGSGSSSRERYGDSPYADGYRVADSPPSSSAYVFLRTLRYPLAHTAALTRLGQLQMTQAGIAAFQRYPHLAREVPLFVRASGSHRVVDSAARFVAGFQGAAAAAGGGGAGEDDITDSKEQQMEGALGPEGLSQVDGVLPVIGGLGVAAAPMKMSTKTRVPTPENSHPGVSLPTPDPVLDGRAGAGDGSAPPGSGIAVVIPEGGAGTNNTLDHGACGAFERDSKARLQQARFLDVWAPPVAERINGALPGAQVKPTEVVMLMDLCAFHTVAGGGTAGEGEGDGEGEVGSDARTATARPSATPRLSPFCPLFASHEWAAYDYYQTLGKYYSYGPGHPLGPAQGAGFVAELVARLTGTPVGEMGGNGKREKGSGGAEGVGADISDVGGNDSGGGPGNINHTLAADPATFPLGTRRWRLFADFSHDNAMTAIAAALGLYSSAPDPASAGAHRHFGDNPLGQNHSVAGMFGENPAAGPLDGQVPVSSTQTTPLPLTRIRNATQAGGYAASWTVPFAGRFYIEKLACTVDDDGDGGNASDNEGNANVYDGSEDNDGGVDQNDEDDRNHNPNPNHNTRTVAPFSSSSSSTRPRKTEAEFVRILVNDRVVLPDTHVCTAAAAAGGAHGERGCRLDDFVRGLRHVVAGDGWEMC